MRFILKRNAISEIIDLLYKHRKLSKSDISRMTGLSTSTISKYINYLLNEKIICASYSNAKKGDKKCTRYNLYHNRYFVIYDFTAKDCIMHICNLSGKIRKTFTYQWLEESPFEDNRFFFQKASDAQLSKYGKNKLCGSAVIFSDVYDNNLINQSRFHTLVNGLKLGEIISIDKDRLFKAEAIKELLSTSDYCLCLFLNNESFSSCYLTNATAISDIHFHEIGSSFKVKGIPIKDYVDYMEDITDIIEQLSVLIKNICEIAPVNKIFITGNLFTHMDALSTLISQKFIGSDLIFEQINHVDYADFIIKKLRNSLSEALINNYLTK